jgi:hypothetical protein
MSSRQNPKVELHFGKERFLLLEKVHVQIGGYSRNDFGDICLNLKLQG